MPRYGTGFTKAAPAAGTFVSQIRTPADRDIRIFEVGVFSSTAVALSVGLIRSLAVGATFTGVVPQPEEFGARASTVNVDQTATTQPTITANTYIRKLVLPATVGSGVIWTFPQGLTVPVNAGMLLWNFGGAVGPAVDGYWVHDE